jgi:hypothetical protein
MAFHLSRCQNPELMRRRSKMIMTVFAGIADFERDLIWERTTGGRQALFA